MPLQVKSAQQRRVRQPRQITCKWPCIQPCDRWKFPTNYYSVYIKVSTWKTQNRTNLTHDKSMKTWNGTFQTAWSRRFSWSRSCSGLISRKRADKRKLVFFQRGAQRPIEALAVCAIAAQSIPNKHLGFGRECYIYSAQGY